MHEEDEGQGKTWWQSRTLAVAALTALVAVLADPDVAALVPPAWLPKLMLASAILTALLRVVTKGPVKR